MDPNTEANHRDTSNGPTLSRAHANMDEISHADTSVRRSISALLTILKNQVSFTDSYLRIARGISDEPTNMTTEEKSKFGDLVCNILKMWADNPIHEKNSNMDSFHLNSLRGLSSLSQFYSLFTAENYTLLEHAPIHLQQHSSNPNELSHLYLHITPWDFKTGETRKLKEESDVNITRTYVNWDPLSCAKLASHLLLNEEMEASFLKLKIMNATLDNSSESNQTRTEKLVIFSDHKNSNLLFSQIKEFLQKHSPKVLGEGPLFTERITDGVFSGDEPLPLEHYGQEQESFSTRRARLLRFAVARAIQDHINLLPHSDTSQKLLQVVQNELGKYQEDVKEVLAEFGSGEQTDDSVIFSLKVLKAFVDELGQEMAVEQIIDAIPRVAPIFKIDPQNLSKNLYSDLT